MNVPFQLFNEELGERVRTARERERMLQGELARAAGVSKKVMSQIELGTATPNAYVLARIAETLDCTIDDLVPLTTVRS